MYNITSRVKTGGLLILFLISTLSIIIASVAESAAGLDITLNQSTNISCNGNSDGAIEVSITGGSGNYSYSWSGPNSFSSASRDLNTLKAGTYNLNVTDNDDSSLTGSFTITLTEPDLLTLSGSTKTDVLCFQGTSGSITAGTVSGGNSNFEYSINGTTWQTSKTFSDLSAGTYTIRVRDDKGCQASETITISEPNQLVINNTDFSKPTCKGNKDGSIISIDVSGGTSGYQYKLDDGNYQNGKNFNGLGAGNYTIYAKDANGCIATKTITIAEPESLALSGSSSNEISCNGSSDGEIIAGTATGGTPPYEYKINGRSYQTSQTFSGFSNGSYTVTVKDASGCTANENITLSQPDQLTISNSSFQEPDCFGESSGIITAGNGSGGTPPYSYKIDGRSYQSSPTFNGVTQGSYVVSIQDNNGCEASETIVVTEPESLALTGSTFTPVSCNGLIDGTATAGTVSGGNSGFEYSIDGGAFSNSKIFSGLAAGTHTITVRDNKGCEATDSVTITQPDALTLTGSTFTPVSCNGANDGTATAGTVAGGNSGFEYSIDGGAFSTSKNFSGLAAGTHTITVRDDKGCEATNSVTVTQPDPLTLTGSTFTVVSCNAGNDGTATAGTVAGGNSGFEYSIDGGAFSTSKNFSGLAAGTHTITVRDNKGCEATDTVTLTEPEPLTATDATSTPTSCQGSNDGTATAGTPSGGNGNYLYALGNGTFSSTKTFTNLSAGTYTINIKDSKNCQFTQSIEITEPDALNMTEPSSTDATCFGGSDGTITVGTMSGGNGNYQYSINNTDFSSSTTFNDLSAGNYTIFVKDAKNCAYQKTISVGQPDEINATVSKTNVSCFEGLDGTISLSQTTGGHGNFEYSIDANTWQSEATISNLSSGTYNVYVRDKDYPSCVVDLNTVEITQPSAALTADVSTLRTTTYGTATGKATANPSGGTAGYTYEWRNEGASTVLQTTKTATNLPAGNYDLTVTDSKGCIYETTITIIETISANIIPTSICTDNEEELIRTSYFEVEDLTAIGGVGPYTYEWTFGTDSTPSSASGAGSHEVKYTTTGNKNITLTVTDSENVSKEFTYTQFVGECYRDNCGSNDFLIDTYYVGDYDGNRTTVVNCNDGVQKYIHIDLDNQSERYSLYAELTYTITNILTGERATFTENGCFYPKADVPVMARTVPVDWECGSIITVESIYLTFSNNIKWSCGQGPNPKCYSTNNQETVESPLFANAIPNELACFGDEYGTIDVSASGGKAPYEYSISSANSGFQDANTFNNLAAGDYDVWVRDYDGLVYQVPTVTIVQPDAPITLETTVVNPICFGENGEASVTASGGTPFEDGTYQYLWNDASEQTTSTATGLPAGEYTITVIDANDCQAIQTVTIVQPEELTVAETGENQVFGCGFNSTNLDANDPGTGTGEWSIVSGEGGSIQDPTDPNSIFTGTDDTYTLRWTISHNDGTCATTSDMTVTFVSDCSTLDFDGVDDHVIMGDNYPFTSGSFSIEVWVKPESVSGLTTVLSKRDYSNMNSGGYDLVINNGAPTFRWGSNTITTSSKVTTNRWYHLAVIYRNGSLELYVDGIKLATKSASNPSTTSASFMLGAMYDSANPKIPRNYYNGWMEELRIWNTALTTEQLRFMMNQRVENNSGNTKGEVLPLNVPGSLSWNNLQGYYRLMSYEITNGETPDISTNKVNGKLRNIETTQENTAPLPYISNQNASWRNSSTWLRPDVWDVPNGVGINGDYIDWNIAELSHNINSSNQDIYMLGLISKTGELLVDGNVNSQSGQGLTVTHYLRLDGTINLEGESQLVQTEGSILDEASTGYLDRDQQGTENSFNYNYWTSPVSLIGSTNNSGFIIEQVLKDGKDPLNVKPISFSMNFKWADANYTGDTRISKFWLYVFQGNANDYFEWQQLEDNDLLSPGIGYTMKGTRGYVPVSNEQNYTFRGKPNNGDISVSVGVDQNLLTGNPYPSAIDSEQFIQDNLDSFNGSIYFWDHFGPENSHHLIEYVGGYAVYNLSGGVSSASSIDSRINANNDTSTKSPPGKYIPVAQAFFINTKGVSNPTTITYKNKYRAFVPESSSSSQFHAQEDLDPKKGQESNGFKKDNRYKIRVKFESPKGYHRQILVTADGNTTDGFDLGYDAPLIENNVEDMYWLIDETEFVIQGVPDFNLDQVLPIGIKISETGEFAIKIDEVENIPSNFNIYLKDLKTDEYFDISKESYTTNAEETGYFNDRYQIVFRKPQTEISVEEKPGILIEDEILGLQYLKDSDEISLFNPDLINVDLVELYSISGQKIKTFKDVPSEESILLSINQKLSSAVYIVKVYSGEKVISKKVIITK